MSQSQPLVAERYRLVQPLGSGGMGRVWLARDEVLRRDVAIKEVVPPEGLTEAERDELRRRTLREAQAAARLNHANVVRIYDVVETELRPWIVMEYVDSRSLHHVVDEDGPLPPERVAAIGLAVLDALRAAHAAGVLHRDIKPGNVLLAADNRVVLTDFGLATFEGGDGAVTRPGLILGSPQYIAPERAREGISGPEADLWSLGATLYAAVEGHAPYARSTTWATLTALATEDPDPMHRAGPLKPAINALLRKDPRHRATADEVERLLRRVVAGEGRSWWPLPRQRRSRDASPATALPGGGSADGSGGGSADGAPAPASAAAASALAAVPSAASASAAPAQAALAAQTSTGAPGSTIAPAAPELPPPAPTAPTAPTPPKEAVDGAPAGRTSAGVGTAGAPVPESSAPPQTDGAAGDGAQPGRPVSPPRAPAIDGDRTTVALGALARRQERRRRAGALTIALAATIAALITAFALLRDVPTDRDRDGTDTARGGVGTAPAASASAVAGTPASGGAGAGVNPTPRPSFPYQLQDGFAWHADRTGFMIAVPIGWEPWVDTGYPDMRYFRHQPTGRLLGIDQTNEPKSDPVADWTRKQNDRVAAGEFPQYQYINIGAVNYHKVAADWEYTYLPRGNQTRVHVNNRGFVNRSGTKGYAIYWQTPEPRWAEDRWMLDYIFGSFVPAP